MSLYSELALWPAFYAASFSVVGASLYVHEIAQEYARKNLGSEARAFSRENLRENGGKILKATFKPAAVGAGLGILVGMAIALERTDLQEQHQSAYQECLEKAQAEGKQVVIYTPPSIFWPAHCGE